MLYLLAQMSSGLSSLTWIEKAGIIGCLLTQIALTLKVMHMLWTKSEKRDKRVEELQEQIAGLHQKYNQAMIDRERLHSSEIARERDETLRDVTEAIDALNETLSRKPRRERIRNVRAQEPAPESQTDSGEPEDNPIPPGAGV